MVIVTILTKLAETSLVIWTCLLLLRNSRLIRRRMLIDTPWIHLIAMAILLVILANRNFLWYRCVQEWTLIPLPAVILQPIHTDLLFPLVCIRRCSNGIHQFLHRVDTVLCSVCSIVHVIPHLHPIVLHLTIESPVPVSITSQSMVIVFTVLCHLILNVFCSLWLL